MISKKCTIIEGLTRAGKPAQVTGLIEIRENAPFLIKAGVFTLSKTKS
jgi:hypothetical protein